jgi:hypothetical protein
VAVVFLTFLGWVLNDLRLSVRHAVRTIDSTAETANEHLPAILDNARRISTTMQEDLPGILERARSATDNVAEVSADVGSLKEALGQLKANRNPALEDYAESVLGCVEASNGTVGARPLTGVGVRNPVPAKVWAASARRNAKLLTMVAKSKPDLLNRLTSTALGSQWLIQLANKRTTLLNWLKENHPETKALFTGD